LAFNCGFVAQQAVQHNPQQNLQQIESCATSPQQIRKILQLAVQHIHKKSTTKSQIPLR